jgi:hypothetical protein
MQTGCAGSVGRSALDFLARTAGIDRIVATDVDEVRGLCAVNATVAGASHLGYYPKIEFLRLDLTDEEETASYLKQIKPDVILHTGSLYTSSTYYKPLYQILKKLGVKYARPAHTVAKDIFLIYKLMKSVRKTGISTHVLNVSFPDNTIPALAKIGLAPTSGFGNASLVLDAVRSVVAHKLKVPMRNVSVTVIAHHAFCMNPPGTVPYYARIRHLEEDITAKFNVDELVGKAQTHIYGPRWSVIDIVNAHTAAQGARIASAIVNDTGEIICAPGVDGTPGTLPARFDARGAKIVMPSDFSMKEARELFEQGLKIDGIERYEKDGTIVFTEPTVQILEEGLGLKGWRTLRLSDAQKMAKELIVTYEKLTQQLSATAKA